MTTYLSIIMIIAICTKVLVKSRIQEVNNIAGIRPKYQGFFTSNVYSKIMLVAFVTFLTIGFIIEDVISSTVKTTPVILMLLFSAGWFTLLSFKLQKLDNIIQLEKSSSNSPEEEKNKILRFVLLRNALELTRLTLHMSFTVIILLLINVVTRYFYQIF